MVNKIFCSVAFLISGAMLSGCVTTDSASNEGSAVLAAADTEPAPLADETASSEADDEKAAAEDDSKKIICKKAKPATGTRLGARRICHTKAEWAMIYERNKIYLPVLQGTPGDPNVGRQ
jgi:hypothetical protein